VKHKKWLNIAIIAGMLIALLACKVSFSESGGEDSESLKLQLTVQALQIAQTVDALKEVQPEVVEQAESAAQQASGGDQAESAAEESAEEDETPCYASKFVSETVPDGTNYDPNEEFEKSWTLRNVGDCNWEEGTKLVFEDGDNMDGNTVYTSHVVEPNETYTFTLDLKAPATNGGYTGVWRLKSVDGDKMGWYSVVITVGPPPAAFAVTSVTFYMPHTSIDTGCPNDINVKAEITSSAAGTVTYKWEDSTGGSSSKKSVAFTEAGKKIVEYDVTVGATGDYWAKLYIDAPNHQWFGPKDFHVNCTP